MTKNEYIKIKKRLDFILQKAKEQALKEGADITLPEFEIVLSKIIEEFFRTEDINKYDFDLYELELITQEKEETRGYQGDRGLTGEIGPKGEKGDKGELGSKGDKGEQGPEGKSGKPGKDGLRGDEGPQGPQGKTGPQGLQGKTGKDGTVDDEEIKYIRGKLEKGFKDVEGRVIRVGSLADDLENRLRAGLIDIPSTLQEDFILLYDTDLKCFVI